MAGIDVHQHLWPEELVDRLRARSTAPYLRGWTVHTDGEPPFLVDPAHHDVGRRRAADSRPGIGTACLSLSSPLGIEGLSRAEAGVLLGAWHDGVRGLPGGLAGHHRGWASVPVVDPDLEELSGLLAEGFVGVQLPASTLLTPAAWERAADVLAVAEAAGKPVFVHPGTVPAAPDPVPGWWAPVVGHVAQLQACWWAWQALRGRELFGSLRLLFAAGAGLAPMQHERHAVRAGRQMTLDRDVFVDSSATGPQALDALVRALGIDVLVLGSDSPYADPLTPAALERSQGEAASRAIRTVNPARLLDGVDRWSRVAGHPTGRTTIHTTNHTTGQGEGRAWRRVG